MVDPHSRLRRDLHAAARHHGRERRAAGHPALAAFELQRPAVGGQRLRADAGRVPAHVGLARRPVRTPAGVHLRPGRLHALLSGVRPGLEPAGAQPRAGRTGDRRGDDVRHLAGADRPGVPRQGARHRLRRVRRSDRCRRGDRAGRRRRDHLDRRLVVDLLRQRADRRARRDPDAHAGGRVARSRGQAR